MDAASSAQSIAVGRSGGGWVLVSVAEVDVDVLFVCAEAEQVASVTKQVWPMHRVMF